MKTLYFISGTMCVGKTAVCRILQQSLQNSAFIDGDDCWKPRDVANPTEQEQNDVICNIASALRCVEQLSKRYFLLSDAFAKYPRRNTVEIDG